MLSLQASQGHWSYGLRGSSCHLNWWQTLVSSKWCWVCRHAKWKSYGIVKVSIQISKESLRSQTSCNRVAMPAGSPQRWCLKLCGWSLSCSWVTRMLGIPRKRYRQPMDPFTLWAENDQRIGARLLKPSETHHRVTYTLGTRHGATGFRVRLCGFQSCFGLMLTCYFPSLPF
jgi:hypothetical protein